MDNTRGEKIIFLDFDDVLNTSQTLERGKLFENANVQALNAILDLTDTKIVVSSMWRLGATTEELEELLVEAGVHASGLVVESTPYLADRPRGAEIRAWLNKTLVPVGGFVILDNRADMGSCIRHLVQTNQEYGLVFGQVDEVVGLLGGGV